MQNLSNFSAIELTNIIFGIDGSVEFDFPVDMVPSYKLAKENLSQYISDPGTVEQLLSFSHETPLKRALNHAIEMVITDIKSDTNSDIYYYPLLHIDEKAEYRPLGITALYVRQSEFQSHQPFSTSELAAFEETKTPPTGVFNLFDSPDDESIFFHSLYIILIQEIDQYLTERHLTPTDNAEHIHLKTSIPLTAVVNSFFNIKGDTISQNIPAYGQLPNGYTIDQNLKMLGCNEKIAGQLETSFAVGVTGAARKLRPEMQDIRPIVQIDFKEPLTIKDVGFAFTQSAGNYITILDSFLENANDRDEFFRLLYGQMLVAFAQNPVLSGTFFQTTETDRMWQETELFYMSPLN